MTQEALIWDRTAQDLDSLYGKILRIDVDHGFPTYAIPSDNPFVNKAGRPEIWAWGFRNPYRIAFDRNGNGDLYVTAVAETLWEAAYKVDGPGNFGWPLIESTHCVDRLKPRQPPISCNDHDANGNRFKLPVVEYANMQTSHPDTKLGIVGVGTAITGARMYRGSAIPALSGQLVVVDWSESFKTPLGQLFVAQPDGGAAATWPLKRVLTLSSRVIGLAEDLQGELYVLTHEGMGPYGTTGKVLRLVSKKP